MGKPLTARQAAERYRVHRTTVLYWHSHGWKDPDNPTVTHKLTAIGISDTGAKLFDETELVTAEQQTRAKRQRSHRASRKLVAA